MTTRKDSHGRRRVRLLGLSLAALAAACTDGTGPGEVGLLLELVSGGDQRFVAGGPPAEPLVVRVTNGDGEPQSGVLVEWRVIEGGGWIIVPPSERPPSQLPVLESTTDENGLADAVWRVSTGAWEQALQVSAGDQHLTVEVVAEPLVWTDVLDVHAWAEVVDGELRARFRMVNRWARSIGLRPGCFYEAHLRTIHGDPVPGWTAGHCSGLVTPRFLSEGEGLDTGSDPYLWRIATSELEPGIYAVVFRFYDWLEINERLAELPDVTVLAVVE